MTARPATSHRDRHSVHSYFNTCPESPDGKALVYFASTDPECHHGEVRVLDRASGESRVLASSVTVEDPHRTACQQWLSGGRRVVFHDLRDGQWVVVCVDLPTGSERVLARGRMTGWGQPGSDVVPLYGPHFDPGPHTGIELLNVATGEIRAVLTAQALREAYPEVLRQIYGDKPVSAYFPTLSPDRRRVFFKGATPLGGDFRSKQASFREGLFCYDLARKRFLFARMKWGHPAWHPDSRQIINVMNILIDSDTGAERPISGVPRFPGTHPSISPDGRLFTTDSYDGGKQHYSVVIGDLAGGDYETIHRFDNSQGATSWRPSHPHPIFSADGRRLYFNVSASRWTELYVAERAA